MAWGGLVQPAIRQDNREVDRSRLVGGARGGGNRCDALAFPHRYVVVARLLHDWRDSIHSWSAEVWGCQELSAVPIGDRDISSGRAAMTHPLAAFGAVIQKGRAYATGHKECDDSWYSCPKSSGGCADDSRPKECDCGADEWAAVVAALPRPDDPEAVEALAKWMDRIGTDAVRRARGGDYVTWPDLTAVAKAILTELLAGGGSGK